MSEFPTCPRCGGRLLLVRTKAETGNWCCMKGADCEQRAIPYYVLRLRSPAGARERKRDLKEAVVGRDFSNAKDL